MFSLFSQTPADKLIREKCEFRMTDSTQLFNACVHAWKDGAFGLNEYSTKTVAYLGDHEWTLV